MSALDRNIYSDMPIGREDVANAEDIFGPSEAILQGKTTRRKPEAVGTEVAHIPRELHDKIMDITLVGDIFYVNSLGFLVTKSKKVKFTTAQFAPKQTIEMLLRMIRQILILYRQGSLIVREL